MSLINKPLFDIFANLFDYYPTQEFINKFIVDGTGINISAICEHPFMKLSIAYAFVWKNLFKTYPTKKDFMDFIKQFNYTPETSVTIDKTILEQVLNSFMHIRIGLGKSINLDDIFKKFMTMTNEIKSRFYVESFIRAKLRYRFLSRSDLYDDVEDVNTNLISTTIKIMRMHKKCTMPVYKNYNAISQSTFDDYDNPINFSELDIRYMSDHEKIQFIMYKDYHFCLKLLNNASIYIADKDISDEVVKTIVSAYESALDKHVVLLNYSCEWHDDVFTYPNIPGDLYNMLPCICEHHITISHDLYPNYKSLAITRENSIYSLRAPINKNDLEYSNHIFYDKYIINSVELVPENGHKYPLEPYIIYDASCDSSCNNNKNKEDEINILVNDKELADTIQSKYKDSNILVHNDILDNTKNNNIIFYDFVIINSTEETGLYLNYMMQGSILIKLDKTVYIKHMVNGILVSSVDEIYTNIDKLITTDDGKFQKDLLIRGSKIIRYVINSELVESLWKIHIKNSCPIRSNNPRNGNLLYITFAMIYFVKHIDKIIDLNKRINLPAENSSNIVILVDNRPNYLSVLSTLFSMCNLNATWKCRIYTSKNGLKYYEKWLGTIAEIVHSPILDIKKFHIDVYNKLLMDINFWNSLNGYEKCLIIQDDGVLLRKGIERFMKYDYVGAPWIDVPDNQYLKDHVNSELVGNGGLSFRSISAMKRITNEFHKEKKSLFYKNINNIPEDVYFVKHLKKINANMPSMQEALIFSSEEIMHNDSIGFHKIWTYHEPERVKMFFKNLLSTLEKPIK